MKSSYLLEGCENKYISWLVMESYKPILSAITLVQILYFVCMWGSRVSKLD